MANPHIMPDSDLPFSDKLKLRENVLAWISRDVGLENFFFPDASNGKATAQERIAYTHTVVASYLTAPSPLGEAALSRTLTLESAADLRRFTVQLRRGPVGYHQVGRYCMLLESVWDSVNTELDDATWARCAMYFDTALVALRLVYVVAFLRAEYPVGVEDDVVRTSVFHKLVRHFFDTEAPTDFNHNKHTTNFRKLLEAWRVELKTYTDPDKLDSNLRGLENVHGRKVAADFLDQFLRGTQADDSWMLRANYVEGEFAAGRLAKRSAKRVRQKKARSPSPVELSSEPESSEEDEAHAREKDGDFDYAEALHDEEEGTAFQNGSDASSDALSDEQPVRKRGVGRRGASGRQARDVRRSVRVASTISKRKKLMAGRRSSRLQRLEEDEEDAARARRMLRRQGRARPVRRGGARIVQHVYARGADDEDGMDEQEEEEEQEDMLLIEPVPARRGRGRPRRNSMPVRASGRASGTLRRGGRAAVRFQDEEGYYDEREGTEVGLGSTRRTAALPARSGRGRLGRSYVDVETSDLEVDEEVAGASVPQNRLMKALTEADVDLREGDEDVSP